MSRPKTKLVILAGTLALAGLPPAAATGSAGLAPAGGSIATSSVEVESLVAYQTKGKIKVQRHVRFLGVCSADCSVTAVMTLVVPGPNVTRSASGIFPAGELFEGFIDVNKAGAAFLKENKAKSKFRTKITAVNTLTGDTDTDQRVFKFK